MLPGFRFLFAAIMLSMSVLVFGLGAAALLRAAHEEFASNPSWRAAPEVMFAQQPEATKSVLALLSLDMPPAEKAPASDASAEQAAIPLAPNTSERIAALKPEESWPPQSTNRETAKTEIPIAENPAASDAVPASAEIPASADQTRVATIVTSEDPWRENQTVPAHFEPVGAQVAQNADTAATKIATLGGQPASIETTQPAGIGAAKPDESAVKKREQARRAAQRRRIAARARAAAQALAQPANPFAQPAPPAVRAR
jgi:hypothetical protein